MGTVAAADGHLKEYVCLSVLCGSTEVYKQDSTHWSMHKPSSTSGAPVGIRALLNISSF